MAAIEGQFARFCYSDYMAHLPASESDREDAPTGEKRTVIVTVSDEALSSMSSVVDVLKNRGFDVGRVMEITGNIVGTWRGELGTLKSLDGVLDAEDEGHMYTQE